VCTHRACVRTALINEISTGPRPKCPSGCCRGIPSGDLGVRSVLPVPLAARDVAIQSRRSERVRGRVASTVRWSRSGRSGVAGWTSAPPGRSGGAHSSKRRAREQRCRRLRATPLDSVEEPSGSAPYGGGSPGFFSGGVYGTVRLRTRPDLRHSRRGFPIRDARLVHAERPRRDAIAVDRRSGV